MGQEKLNGYGKRIREILGLRSFPVAVKWVEKEADVPAAAIRPMRDLGKHMAFCQAMAYARFRGKAVALATCDHWCWNPLIGFGNVPCEPGTDIFDKVTDIIFIPDKAQAEDFFREFPRLPLGKFEAVVVCPLETADFEPDVVVIYGNVAQINLLVLLHKTLTGKRMKVELDGIDSCIYSTVVPYLSGDFGFTMADPGERHRAMAREDEAEFTVPIAKLDEFMAGLETFDARGVNCGPGGIELPLDHPRPPFYDELFEMWGLYNG
jgi:uncharacterized protein (DUF169 family)